MNRKFRFTRDTMKRLKDFISEKDRHPENEETSADKPSGDCVCCGLTDVGRLRAVNQDVLVLSEELRLYGVADGMGGHKGGETASSGARDSVLASLRDQKPSVDALRDAVKEANAALFRQQAEDENLSGMGTTLSLIWVSEHYVYMGHVGDSRVYRMRGGKLSQMTDDHSLVAELVRAGYITPEQAENHPNRNVITRAVGTEEDIDVDMAVEERQKGDLWLICSDGLHGMVSDAAMEEILRANSVEKAARKLMDAALEAGGRDNISLVILLDGEGEQ